MTPLTPEARLRAWAIGQHVSEDGESWCDTCCLSKGHKDSCPVAAALAVLDDLARTRERERAAWELQRSKLPCGHWSAHAVTEDGGKTIQCLDCTLASAAAETERLLREISALPLTVFAHMDGFVAGEWNCACGSKWMDGEPEQHTPSCLRARALALVTGTEKESSSKTSS